MFFSIGQVTNAPIINMALVNEIGATEITDILRKNGVVAKGEAVSLKAALKRGEGSATLAPFMVNGGAKKRYESGEAAWTAADAIAGKGLYLACRNNNLEDAQWVTDEFGLTPEYVRGEYNIIFRHTCSRGHFRMVKWLAERFGLTKKDVAAQDNEAYLCCAVGGSPYVAEWLHDTYGVGADWGAKCIRMSKEDPARCRKRKCYCPYSCAGVRHNSPLRSKL